MTQTHTHQFLEWDIFSDLALASSSGPMIGFSRWCSMMNPCYCSWWHSLEAPIWRPLQGTWRGHLTPACLGGNRWFCGHVWRWRRWGSKVLRRVSVTGATERCECSGSRSRTASLGLTDTVSSRWDGMLFLGNGVFFWWYFTWQKPFMVFYDSYDLSTLHNQFSLSIKNHFSPCNLILLTCLPFFHHTRLDKIYCGMGRREKIAIFRPIFDLVELKICTMSISFVETYRSLTLTILRLDLHSGYPLEPMRILVVGATQNTKSKGMQISNDDVTRPWIKEDANLFQDIQQSILVKEDYALFALEEKGAQRLKKKGSKRQQQLFYCLDASYSHLEEKDEQRLKKRNFHI